MLRAIFRFGVLGQQRGLSSQISHSSFFERYKIVFAFVIPERGILNLRWERCNNLPLGH